MESTSDKIERLIRKNPLWTKCAVAREAGVHRSRVYQVMHEYGIPFSKPQQHILRLISRHPGITSKELAVYTKSTPQYIEALLAGEKGLKKTIIYSYKLEKQKK